MKTKLKVDKNLSIDVADLLRQAGLDASTVYPHDQFAKFQARRQQPHDRPSSRSYHSQSVAPGVAPNLSHLLKLTV